MANKVDVKINGDAKKLKSELDKADKSISGFAKRALPSLKSVGIGMAALGTAAVGAAAGLFKLANDAAKVLDEIDKGSQRAGTTAEEFQELGFVASQSGTDTQKLVSAMGRLAVTTDKTLTPLKTTRDRLLALSDQVKNATSEQEAMTIASKALGRGVSKDMLPFLLLGAEGIEELEQKARDAGIVMGGDAVKAGVDFTDQMDLLNRQLTKVKTEIGVALIPKLLEGAEKMSAFLASTEGKQKVDDLATSVTTLAEALIFLGTAIPPSLNFLKDISGAKTGTIQGDLLAAVLAKIDRDFARENQPDFSGVRGGASSTSPFDPPTVPPPPTPNAGSDSAAKKAITEAEKEAQEKIRQILTLQRDVSKEIEGVGRARLESAREFALSNENLTESQKQALELEFQSQDIEAERVKRNQELEELRVKALELGELELAQALGKLQAENDILSALQQQGVVRAQKAVEGEEEGSAGVLDQLRTRLTEELERATPTLDTLVDGANNLASGLLSAATSGESFGETFKTIASQFLQQIAQMIIQALILKAILAALGLGGAGSITGLIGLGSSAGAGAASGGFRRGITLVGEQGPELVNFGRGGANVTSAMSTQKALGGTSLNVSVENNAAGVSVTPRITPEGVRFLVRDEMSQDIGRNGQITRQLQGNQGTTRNVRNR